MKYIRLIISKFLFCCISSLAILSTVSLAQAEPLQDNSFLVEEAYNQETGVVQFIQVWQKQTKGDDWRYTFINEIPIGSQNHQFSYELPVQHLDSRNKNQLSDVKLNYRYEILRTDAAVMTARGSLILPSGDYKKGFGSGATGAETAIMASVQFSPKWIQHWNLGAGLTPDARNIAGNKADNSHYFWGFSHVYMYRDNLNFMLEVTGATSSETTAPDKTAWGQEVLISPSVRYAIDHKDWQYVPGLAFPIGVGPNVGENQVLIYFSVEGKMF